MRIQRIADACQLMVTDRQSGTLNALAALRREIEQDPAGWLNDWWLCRKDPEVADVFPGHDKLGQTIVQIVFYQQAQNITDMRLLKYEIGELRRELAEERAAKVKTRAFDSTVGD